MARARVVIDQAGMNALLRDVSGPVAADLLRRVIQVEATAKRLCPVDTGRLRSSITHELGVDSRGLVGTVGTNVTYAPYVEFGTSRMRAQPFLRPALDAAR
jgi:HK97 gp10 family phage protein